jgi:YD repeat-containing protein
VRHRLRTHFPDALFISVQTGEGIPALLARMGELAAPGTVTRELRIPASDSRLLARLHREAKVHGITYDGSDSLVTATLPARLAGECERYVQVPQKPRPPGRGKSKAGNLFRDTGPEKSYGKPPAAKMRKAQSNA